MRAVPYARCSSRIEPGVLSPKHLPTGEEIVYFIEGSLEYQVEGTLPVTLNAGEVLFIPAEAPTP